MDDEALTTLLKKAVEDKGKKINGGEQAKRPKSIANSVAPTGKKRKRTDPSLKIPKPKIQNPTKRTKPTAGQDEAKTKRKAKAKLALGKQTLA